MADPALSEPTDLTNISRSIEIQAARRAAALQGTYGHLSGEELLRPLISQEFRGRIALVSSFGTESAALLGMVAAVDKSLPVLFIDTGKLFGETLRYRDDLVARLGLTDVRTIGPKADRVAAADPDGMLFHRDPDACCALRKVEPLSAALEGVDAWISGRKRYQGGARTALPTFEAAAGRVKVNPLAGWSFEAVEAAFVTYRLPRHPLEEEGFLSVGCMPCTKRIAPGADRRAGRWAGMGKTECGIHVPLKRVS
jgi:phosphoadenosine phosphosulfate reductase